MKIQILEIYKLLEVIESQKYMRIKLALRKICVHDTGPLEKHLPTPLIYMDTNNDYITPTHGARAG